MKLNFPSKLFDKIMETEKEVPRGATVEMKPVYLSPPFKGDTVADVAHRRLASAITKTF